MISSSLNPCGNSWCNEIDTTIQNTWNSDTQ